MKSALTRVNPDLKGVPTDLKNKLGFKSENQVIAYLACLYDEIYDDLKFQDHKAAIEKAEEYKKTRVYDDEETKARVVV